MITDFFEILIKGSEKCWDNGLKWVHNRPCLGTCTEKSRWPGPFMKISCGWESSEVSIMQKKSGCVWGRWPCSWFLVKMTKKLLFSFLP